MPSPLTFADVEELFRTLGVKSFGAALPEGRIQWTNEAGEVVAHARCQAVLSWAATNNSLMWAEALGHFQQAGVPCLPKLDGEEDYLEGVTEEQAQELATQAAQLTGAQFLYAAPMGGGGQLFLAVREFRAGAEAPDPDAEERRQDATRAWAGQKLRGLAKVIREGRTDEARALLGALPDQATQQAEYVVQGTPVAARLKDLADQARGWSESLGEAGSEAGEETAERLAYELDIAARGFVTPAEA